MGEITELVRSERVALIDLLETLSPQEWATSSLCDAWTVQQVAAHLAWAPVEPLRRALPELIRHRFRLNAMNAALAIRWAERGTAAILEQLRRNAADGARPIGVPDAHALRLVASDVDWSHGTGPDVRTSPEALLLVLAGRPVDAAELSGTGAVELSHRL
jgi:Mycothiol maleylpyruvate isomerase N-terminal domain